MILFVMAAGIDREALLIAKKCAARFVLTAG